MNDTTKSESRQPIFVGNYEFLPSNAQRIGFFKEEARLRRTFRILAKKAILTALTCGGVTNLAQVVAENVRNSQKYVH